MILVGCEESQTVCKAFRDEGYEAYSCDLVPTRSNPDWHLQCDIMDLLGSGKPKSPPASIGRYIYWDLIILHPDCTAMAVSGNRWYGKGMPYNEERKKAIKWTQELWRKAWVKGRRVALENPVSAIFKELDAPVQYIQPWQFGHGETKKTGLALHNLPPLKPTNIVEGREQRIWKMPPSETRKRDRSVTYPGIAKAMAQQWGPLCTPT